MLWLAPVSSHFIYPRTRIEARPVIQYMQQHRQEGDIVYVYYRALRVFRYYARLYGFHEAPYILGTRSSERHKNYIEDVQQLQGQKRVWFIFSGAYGEQEFFLSHLEMIGTRLDGGESVGTAVYLYNLAPEKGI